MKITIIGAGSTTFCPATVKDIMLSDMLNSVPLEICLMDIDEYAANLSLQYALKANEIAGRKVKLWATTDLDRALDGTQFVVNALEKDRYHYWSQDFHIPRRYGFRQIWGENGGPGSLFHTLRNLHPIMNIIRRMETLCPDALFINYSNPEAKLVQAVSALGKIKAVGVCHGFEMGVQQLEKLLDIPRDDMDLVACGMNHFGWFTSMKRKSTGEDLYPVLREKEAQGNWLCDWDNLALQRIMFRTFGVWPTLGANHIGEYISWGQDFLASAHLQFFFDPAADHPWETRNPPKFIYSFSENPTNVPFLHKDNDRSADFAETFQHKTEELVGSSEYGIPIIEAVAFDLDRYIPSLNVANHGCMPDVMDGMCIEGPCRVDKDGVHPLAMPKLPAGITAMINQQAAVMSALTESYAELSRNKLLQALLLDPTCSTYENAVALIDEMFERQGDILPPLQW